MKTNIHIFNTNVKSVLLYGLELWEVISQIKNKLQTFVNQGLRRIMGMTEPKVISNPKLWEATGKKPTILQTEMIKQQWVSHTLRKGDEYIAKQAFDWNMQGTRSGRPKQNWKRTVLEKKKIGKTWSEVKRLAGSRVR
jgi:hypothetical protein